MNKIEKNQKKKLLKLNLNGWTSLELLIVIGIIGTLATLIYISGSNFIKSSRDIQRVASLKNFQKALRLYYADYGYYPPACNNDSGDIDSTGFVYKNRNNNKTCQTEVISLKVDDSTAQGLLGVLFPEYLEVNFWEDPLIPQVATDRYNCRYVIPKYPGCDTTWSDCKNIEGACVADRYFLHCTLEKSMHLAKNDGGTNNEAYEIWGGPDGSDTPWLCLKGLPGDNPDPNQVPILYAIGDKTVNEEESINFSVSGYDPDYDETFIEFLEDYQWNWMSFDGTTFTATPDHDDSDNYELTFRISDGKITSQETITLTVVDTGGVGPPPAKPTNLSAVVNGFNVDLTWDANTEPDMDGYNVYQSNTPGWPYGFKVNPFLVGLPSYTDVGIPEGVYYYVVTAVDTEANESLFSNEIFTRVGNPNDLQIYLRFDEGSGLTTVDSSGNGNDGTISGAQWVMGKEGNALNFEGNGDYVDLGTFDIDNNAMTMAAWVRPYTLDMDGARIISKAIGGQEQDQYWVLKVIEVSSTLRLQFSLKTGITTSTVEAQSGYLSLKEWSHVAVVYNGTKVQLYKNAIEVASMDKTGFITQDNTISVAIGNNPPGAGNNAFNGMIDEVLVYNRSLSVAELQELMANEPPVLDPIGGKQVDEEQVLNFSVSASDPDGSSVSISVYGINLYTWMSFDGTNFTASPNASHSGEYPLTFTATDGDLTDEETINLVVIDAVAGNPAPDPPSNLSSAVNAHDVNLNWDANSEPDLVGYNIYRTLTSGGPYGSPLNGASLLSSPSYTDLDREEDTYYYVVTAVDTDSYESIFSTETTAIVSLDENLIALYNFDEGSGNTVHDSSNNSNHGTIFEATWTTDGKYSNALVFDGTDDWVTVSDDNSLDLTNQMTIAAWVNPETVNGWRTVLMKETSVGLAYSLYAGGLPNVYMHSTGDIGTIGSTPLPINTWTHLAGTYDGTNLRLYVNGSEAAISSSVSGNIIDSSQPLRIGGNSFWGEYFQGKIDEVRIYNRVLTEQELQNLISVGS